MTGHHPSNARYIPSNRPNGWVRLDQAWARSLGIQKDRGVYRIRHRELVRRLQAALLPVPSPGKWRIDPDHTNVGFVAPHLVVAKVRGGFRQVSGTICLGPTPKESWVDVTVETGSVDTGLRVRDDHLRSEDFLDAANHPHMRFRSTDLEAFDGRTGKLTGDLTMRGVTRPVTLNLEYLGSVTDHLGQPKVVFEANAQIDREEFGLVWNRPLEAGGLLVGRHIELQIEAQAVATAA